MPEAEKSTPAPAALPTPTDHIVRTQHVLKVGSKTLKYTVNAGTVVLREERAKDGNREGDKARANMFFMAYTLEGVKDKAARPVTFVFNGGPGSSSVWLHLGVIGPKRIQMDEMGNAPPPPFALIDNPHTLLAESDLVFIDPIGTGYSRMVDGEPESEFHEYQRDLESVGEFIRLYCTREERWGSPKYLAGESYGTTRAVGLAGHLQEKFGMYLNGLILISLALDFSHLRFDVGNDVPYSLYLPTYAATAWYHGKLEAPLQKKPLRKLLNEVEDYAGRDYLTALFKGRALGKADQAALTAQLAKYTGLSPAYIEAAGQRIEIMRFCKELLRGEGRTVGRLDTRYTGFDRDNAGETMEGDPAMYAILGAYATCMNDYVRRELKVTIDVPYNAIAGLYNTWNYKAFTGRYLHVADVLRKAMSMNPHLKVLVCNGYYDLATPHFASDYTFNHLGGPGALDMRIEKRYYEAGHMMYVHQPSLRAVAADMLGFVRAMP